MLLSLVTMLMKQEGMVCCVVGTGYVVLYCWYRVWCIFIIGTRHGVFLLLLQGMACFIVSSVGYYGLAIVTRPPHRLLLLTLYRGGY